MANVDQIVKNILEGKDITASLLGEGIEEVQVQEAPSAAYYEIVYGYFVSVVKMDAPTTNYGAIVDVLIDALEEEGVGENILMPLDQAEAEYNEDEYVVGGNHSLALITNGNFRIEEITEDRANELNSTENVDIYCESYQVTEDGAGKLVSARIVQEPYGRGVEIKTSTGAIYKYAVDEEDPKYFTAEKVLHAVQALARRNNYDMGKIYTFLKTHTLGDYDKDVTGRANLDKAEIVAEPNGEGLKVTLDNGKVYRYTVDQEDEKYDTLEKLKDGAEGMWRHSASVDGILNFLDRHAILYAREAMEQFLNRRLSEKKD